ncbi:MAG: diguanylate cyclase [Spirochaetes bacterium]|nr:diguanylate cyclase [Spirochaetota bacterium]
MNLIELKTLIIIYIFTAFICLVVMAALWRQNRGRYPGISLWLADYVLQFMGLVLVSFRDILPPLMSPVAGNVIVIGGTVMLYEGLGRFTGRKVRRFHNYVMLAVFTAVHVYFTVGYLSLPLRNINLSFALLFLCLQCAWLMLRGADRTLRPATRPAGVVFALYCLVSVLYIAATVAMPPGNEFWTSGIIPGLVLLSYMMLFILLTFSLALMINRRLVSDVEREFAEKLRAGENLRVSEEKFAKAFQTSPYAIAITRLEDGSLVEVNDAFLLITGYSREELVGKTSIDLNLWVNLENRDEVTAEIRAGRPVTDRVFRFRKKKGEILTGLFSAQTLVIDGTMCLLSSIADITNRIRAEEDLKGHRRFLYDLIERSGNLICIKDRDGRYDLVNTAWEQKTGLNRGGVLGRTDEEIFPGETGQQFRRNDLEVMETGQTLEKEEVLEDAQGTRYFISIKFPLRDNNDVVTGLCGMITEITERKRAEERIRHLATHDALTGLPGLRLSKDRLAMALGQARRMQNSVAVMFIDLDNFKSVNDTLGHDAGDHVLIETARRLQSCVRETDTVARIGGDEFLVIVTGVTAPEDAAPIARKIIGAVSLPIVIGGKEAVLGTSIGIAIAPEHGEEMDRLIKLADNAMYRVKNSGKNGYCFVGEEGECGGGE